MTTTMTNNLMMFEGKNVEVFDWNGTILFNSKHVADILDIKNVRDNISRMNSKQVVKLTNSIVGDTDFRKLHNTGENFLTESGVYKLIFKSHKEEAEKFQDWVTDIVLPTIRKTGGFVADPEQFINTYLPFADEPTKLLFKSTLAVITNQNGIIAKQQNDIDYKSDIIKGLVEDIPLASKRQILNRVVMKCSNFNDRWSELYKAFELKYKTRINTRMEFYNKTHKSKLRSKLEYIEEIGMIDELYSIACKLYENEVNVLVEEMYRLHEIV